MESSLSTLLRPDLDWADKIAYLAYKLSQSGGVGPEAFPVKHSFRDGLYIREFELPAETLFIGRIHRVGHKVTLIEGTADLITQYGKRRYQGPDSIMTPASFQTVAFTLTRCVVETVHENPSGSRDIDKLELEAFESAQPILDRGRLVMQELLT